MIRSLAVWGLNQSSWKADLVWLNSCDLYAQKRGRTSLGSKCPGLWKRILGQALAAWQRKLLTCLCPTSFLYKRVDNISLLPTFQRWASCHQCRCFSSYIPSWELWGLCCPKESPPTCCHYQGQKTSPLRVLMGQPPGCLAGRGCATTGWMWQNVPHRQSGRRWEALRLLLWSKNMLRFVSFSRKHLSGLVGNFIPCPPFFSKETKI